MTLRHFILCSLILLPEFAFALPYSSDEEMYVAVIGHIAKEQHARKLAVYYEVLRPDELVEDKVPRHQPKGQFSRAIPGVSAEMELELLYASKKQPSYLLKEFAWSASGIEFLGFLDSSSLHALETSKGTREFENLVVAVKFSRIAYNSAHSKALIYAESGRVQASLGSSGDAFLFVHERTGWRLQASAGLWGGGPKFWLE